MDRQVPQATASARHSNLGLRTTYLPTDRPTPRRLALALRAPPASFSAPIPVPTSSGFSEVPGCRESYEAVASLVASGRPSRRAPWAEVGRWEVPLAVLEFGGTYQCTRAEQQKAHHTTR